MSFDLSLLVSRPKSYQLLLAGGTLARGNSGSEHSRAQSHLDLSAGVALHEENVALETHGLIG